MHATPVPCPHPSPPASSTAHPVPPAAHTRLPPPAPATAAPAQPGAAKHATAVPWPRPPPPTSPNEPPVPRDARAHAPPRTPPAPSHVQDPLQDLEVGPPPPPPQAPAHLAWWYAHALRELPTWLKWAEEQEGEKGCTWCTPLRRSAPAARPTQTRPARRPPCRRRRGKPSSRTRSKAFAPPTAPKSSISAPQAPTQRQPPHRAGKGHRQEEGKGRERTPRQEGKEGPKVTGRRPQGQGTGGDTTREQETTHGQGRGRNRDRGAGKEDTTAGTRAHMQERHATTEGPAPPHPQADTERPPEAHTPNTRHRSTNRTPYRPHRLMPTGHRKPHRGREAHPHGEKGLQPQGRTPRTPPRSPPPRPHRQTTTPATTTTGPPHRHEKRKGARPQHPGLEARTLRGHRTTAQAPREGSSADTHMTHQPERHTQTPTARAQRATPHLTAPPSQQPPTPRPALRTTTRARLATTFPPRHNTRQQGTPHRSVKLCNAPRQSTPRHDTPQHNAA